MRVVYGSHLLWGGVLVQAMLSVTPPDRKAQALSMAESCTC